MSDGGPRIEEDTERQAHEERIPCNNGVMHL